MSTVLPGLEYTLKYESLPLSKRFDVTGTQNLKASMRTLTGGVNLNNGVDFVDPDTGFTPLMVATIQGKVQVVRALIDRGAALEYQEQDKLRTVLIIAAHYGKAECVEEILRRGALINAIDKYEMTALMHASKHGHKDCVAILLSRGAAVNKVDDHGFTAVHLAAKFGHVQIVEMLFEKGASLEIRDLVEGKTPLHLAAQYGRKETVRCLLDREAKINRRSTFDKSTAIMLASKEGHKSTVQLLIARGADANLVDLYGWAPLHFAASWGRKDTALILIVEGNADVNSCETTAKGEGGTPPLIVAAKGAHKEIIKLFLQYGADVNYPEMHHGHTALAAAAELGLPEVAQLLLDYGANINYKNHLTGTTALMMAASAGRRGAIVTLLNNLADINILDNRSMNALMHAEKAGFRDVLLSAMVHVTPFAKVNLVPWIEMECPHMVRGSLGGSPAVFLNSTLYTHHGLYCGLLRMPADCDVYLLYCLVMLAAACKRSMFTHPYDRPELCAKLAHIDAMLCHIVKARAMCIDAVFNDCFILGHKPVATLGRYHIKYFASAFTTGPLALYIENDLTELLAAPPMREKIDRSFWACLRDKSPSIGDYGNRTPLQHARYVPALMFLFEGLGKLLLLGVIVSHSTVARGSEIFVSTAQRTIAANFDPTETIVLIMLLSVCLYEIGNMEEKRWAVSPSVVFNIAELEMRRKRAVLVHFLQDPYRFSDLCTCAFGLVWFGTACATRGQEQSLISAVGEKFLIFATVPLCFGLLRYPAAFFPAFGQQVLTVCLICEAFLPLLLIFMVTGLGFGVVLYGVFRGENTEFHTPGRSLQTLFDAVLTNYDTTLFDASSNHALGVSTALLFLLWAVVVLFTSLIAHASSRYAALSSQANHWNCLIKAKTIQQLSVAYEKSPFCMLPAPFNLITTAVYAFHVYYAWRAKLYSTRLYCISFGGTVADYTMFFVLLPFTALYEYNHRILFSTLGEGNKFFLILLAPLGLLYCAGCLIYKFISEPYAKLIVKSRISDGRLRVSYGYRRDNIENNSLGHFEDERLSKFLGTFIGREYAVSEASVSTPGTEGYRNVTGGADNDDYRGAEVESRDYTYDEEGDDVSKVTLGSSVVGGTAASKGGDSLSLMTRLQTKFKPAREATYTGRKIRVVPSSPFLQLSRVHEVAEVQAAIPRVVPPPLYRRALVPLPLAVQQQMHQQKQINNSLLNKPDVPENASEEHEERAPVLFLENGTISPYQPGLTSQPQLEHFTGSVDVDYQDEAYVPPVQEGTYFTAQGAVAMAPTGENWMGPAPLDQFQEALHTTAYHEYTSYQQDPHHQHLQQLNATTAQPTPAATGEAAKDPAAAADAARKAQEDKQAQDELHLLQHPSIYFLRNKFPPIFLDSERKAIFEIVLPEMYVTDFAASVKDTETHMIATQDRLRLVEKQLQMQTMLLQRLLAPQPQPQYAPQQSVHQPAQPPQGRYAQY